MAFLRVIVALALLGWAAPAAAAGSQLDATLDGPAPDPAPNTPDADNALVRAVIGTATTILLHELAHALIGETGLPATGPEEDVADAFAALVLTSASATSGEQAARKMTEYGVLFWYYSGLARQGQEAGDWQDEHASDLKRFRNSFCLIYGRAPELFAEVADRVGMTDITRARCLDEADKQFRAWGAILETIRRPEGAPGGRIRVHFEDSQLLAGRIIKAWLGDNGRARAMLEVFERSLALPRDISVTFADCPQYNAWYDPNAGAITLCYALFDLTAATVLDGLGITDPDLPPRIAAPAPNPAPAPDPAAESGLSPAMRFMLGTWRTTYSAGDGQPYEAIVIYEPDGRYGLRYEGPQGPVMIAGRWSATVNDDTVVVISVWPERWEPRELCDGAGKCVPNDQQPDSFAVDLIDADTVAVNGLTWQRVARP